jgi:Mn2+/Fe2+ NRAMP family transporter
VSIAVYTPREASRRLGISRRQLAYLARKDHIEPVVREGRLHYPAEEIDRYRALPHERRLAHRDSYFKTLGPGLITGASDDDPSGIGTYSTVGAAYGLTLSWLALYLLPMMMAVQETSARIGIVTGRGLTGAISERYGRRVLYPLVLLLLVANTFNIGADIAAMASSLQLLVPVDFYVAAIGLTLGMLALEIFFSYRRYSRVLKWLTVSLFAYVITGFIVQPDWAAVARSLVIPQIQFNAAFIAALVAVMGTTISPYLFFWQTSEEVEEIEAEAGDLPEHHRVAMHTEIRHMRTDTITGMSVANIVFLFIVITTATVLFSHGFTNITSAQEAAAVLKPLAGRFAALLFTAGIVGTGLLAVPVMAGSSAYALSELLKWNEGLSKRYDKARGFYGIIIASMVVGLGVTAFGVNPIKALYYAAILNGIASPILMFFIFRIGRDAGIMRGFTNPRWVNIWGTIATALMGVAAIVLIVLLATGR